MGRESASPFQDEFERELHCVLERYPKLEGLKILEFDIDTQSNYFFVEMRSNSIGGFILEIDSNVDTSVGSYEEFIEDMEERIGGDRLLDITLYDWN